MLLAQARGAGPFTTTGSGPPPEVVLAAALVGALVLIVMLVIGIFYLLSLSKALSLCSPRNRTMEPGLVWLNLIPCFNLVWIFITVIRVGDSLKNEFDDRRLRDEGDYGKTMGIVYLILYLVGVIPAGIINTFLFPVGYVFVAPSFICFILYWVKIAGFNRKLKDSERDYDRDDRDYRRRDVDDDYGERFRDRDRKRREEGYPDRGDDDDRVRDR